MKNSLLLFAFLLLSSLQIFAQEPEKRPVPRLKKYDIAKTGCAVYMPDAPEFELVKSEDGSDVYTGEVVFDNFNYAVICVKFSEPIPKEGRGDLLTAYMDFLQQQFGIEASAGYGKGHTLERYPEAEGIIDYWKDADGNEWAVKGWIDGNYIAVLCLYGATEFHYINVQQMFLNGFQFPQK